MQGSKTYEPLSHQLTKTEAHAANVPRRAVTHASAGTRQLTDNQASTTH